MTPKNLASSLRLMLVTDDRLVAGRDLVQLCEAAADGGVTAIQLRLREATARDLATLLGRLRLSVSIPILLNDRADVALACGADGVHLGPEDVPVPLVRSLGGKGFWVGASVGSTEEVDGGRGADYWGVGPLNSTSTKTDAGSALGFEGFSAIVRMGEGRACIAIGGVRPEDVPEVLRAGGVGVAVASGILGQADIRAAAERYAATFSTEP